MARTPLFNWLDHRGSGVLLHPTSLPSAYGVGCFDEACRDFIDFLAEAGFTHWQLCPLGPTGYGDSPYQSFSSFAGNPYLIDLAPLRDAGGILEGQLLDLAMLPTDRVDYGALYQHKLIVLRKAYESYAAGKMKLPYGSFEFFKQENAGWLDPYAYFLALKERHHGEAWTQWPAALGSYEKAKKHALGKKLATRIDAHKFNQYLFFSQWELVRQYAAKRGVRIIGDIPIFAALDSADLWEHAELFQFSTRNRQPLAVAGSPPDYFAPDGQLWGNPLYDWDAMKNDGYAWWLERIKASFAMYDIARIDHFRGFDAYWRIPYKAKTAREGKWIEGPGLDFFKAIKKRIKHCPLIAEDLGDITESAKQLQQDSGLPGMAVLQFAFGGDASNPYLPHNVSANTVIYTGTHDNDTTRGWYAQLDEGTRDQLRRYFRVDGSEVAWDLIRAALASTAKLAIIPMQDLLNLGSEARFNTPGEAAGNWQWRLHKKQLQGLRGETAAYLRALQTLYGRFEPSR